MDIMGHCPDVPSSLTHSSPQLLEVLAAVLAVTSFSRSCSWPNGAAPLKLRSPSWGSPIQSLDKDLLPLFHFGITLEDHPCSSRAPCRVSWGLFYISVQHLPLLDSVSPTSWQALLLAQPPSASYAPTSLSLSFPGNLNLRPALSIRHTVWCLMASQVLF